MAECQVIDSIKVPVTLTHLIQLNVKYQVLVCLDAHCCKAVSCVGLVEHFRKIHKEKPELRKQIYEYIQRIPFNYNYSTIQLPVDGLAPQPVLPVVNGFQCQHCKFYTTNRRVMKKHGNKQHIMQRVDDDQLFQAVRLQTWFRDGKERYWVVDESREAEAVQGTHQLGKSDHSNLYSNQLMN